MSASTEKKNRRAAREAGTDKKTNAAAEEAAKKAKSNLKWTLGTIAVVLLIALIFFLDSNFLYQHTTAVTIGEEKYSPADVNLRYAQQYQQFASQYGSYASIFGLDTSKGLAGLGSQDCPMLEEGGSWKDYFMQTAEQQMIQEYSLCKYAEENGIELSQEEIDAADSSIEGIESMAKAYGFSSADNYFEANYGNGVNTAVVREAMLTEALSAKAGSHYMDSLEYSDAELEEHYASFEGKQDMFDFDYVYVEGEKTDSTGEDGETVQTVSAEALEAAGKTADAVAAAYREAKPEKDFAAALNTAIASELKDTTCTERSNAVGGSLSDVYSEWLMGSRKAGDIKVFKNNNDEGYYVVVFEGRSDNHYNVAQVRHILVKAVPEEDGSYSDAAKAEAKARAEEILAQWEDGDKTEESFAALAEEFSEDEGSKANGGLYDSVARGQMVPEFDAFCFAGNKPGTTGIVYGESGAYAGYHVMYYVGEGELYSNVLSRNDLVNTAMTEWLASLAEPLTADKGFFLRLAA